MLSMADVRPGRCVERHELASGPMPVDLTNLKFRSQSHIELTENCRKQGNLMRGIPSCVYASWKPQLLKAAT